MDTQDTFRNAHPNCSCTYELIIKKEYKPLTDEQKAQMDLVKEKAEELMSILDNNTPLPGVSGVKGRCMSIAKTELETSVMWAVKGITS